jgi:hypothetical protein
MNFSGVRHMTRLPLERTGDCPRCKTQVVARERLPGPPNHTGHAVLTVLTLGLWLPVALVAAFARGVRDARGYPFHCTRCGTRVRTAR